MSKEPAPLPRASCKKSAEHDWDKQDLATQGASNIKTQGKRSQALGEAYNNFEPRQR